MSQVNLVKRPSFTMPPAGCRAYGIDENGVPVVIDENGVHSPIATIAQAVQAILANRGVGLLEDLPVSFIGGDIYVTTDTFKIYIAIDSVDWTIVDLIVKQFVTDLTTNLLYQFTGVSLVQLTLDPSTKADLVGGKVPASQLPSYVDDVLEFANSGAFPVTGETGIIYIALDSNKQYRWSGTVYVEYGSQVQSDWNQSNSSLPDFIKNKPVLSTPLSTYVGTGKAYTDLQTAYNAGYRKFILSENYTMTANLSLQGSEITAINELIELRTNKYTVISDNCYYHNLIIRCLDVIPMTKSGMYGSIPIFKHVHFIQEVTDNSYGGDIYPILIHGHLFNCEVTLPNQRECGFGNNSNNFNGVIDGLLMYGGGANCNRGITMDLNSKDTVCKNIGIYCTFGTNNYAITANTVEYVEGSYGGSNLGINALNIAHIQASNGFHLISASYTIIIESSIIYSFATGITNIRIVDSEFVNPISFANTLFLQLANCTFKETVTFNYRALISNCIFEKVTTFAGSCIMCSLSYFILGLLVTGSNNNITTSFVGAGSTSYTITFNSGANNNIAIANQVDSAIVNNGTGNTVTPNVVF